MNRIWILILVAAYPVMALTTLAQTAAPSSAPYQPVVPAPSTVNSYGGWGVYGGSGGGTAAGSALNGMASVISAQGDYNLSTSAAAVNMTQAQKNEIQNRQQWTNTYFDMRHTNRMARAAERAPTPTMEQIARIARDGAPKPLTPSQVDPVSGRINWPGLLRQPQFESQRAEVDRAFAELARYGALSYSDETAVRAAIDGMFDGLKAKVREVPSADYVACRTLLQSLGYAASKMDLH
jgi:hypothetical protein